MEAVPIFTLLTPTIPPRTQRSIRRALADLGARVHVPTEEADVLPKGTTHLVLSSPLTHPLYALATASAADVRLVTPAFVTSADSAASLTPPSSPSHTPVAEPDPTRLLPGCPEAPWLGFPWAGAHAFWRARQRPLHGHCVVIVGETRPAGPVGLAAPTTRDVFNLLVSAGANVTLRHRSASFAVVAPGITPRNNEQVRELVDAGVLCLGSGFVIDLLVRVNATPAEYILFEQQRALCGPPLNTQTIPKLSGPLPVARCPEAPDNHLEAVQSAVVTPSAIANDIQCDRRDPPDAVLLKLPLRPHSTFEAEVLSKPQSQPPLSGPASPSPAHDGSSARIAYAPPSARCESSTPVAVAQSSTPPKLPALANSSSSPPQPEQAAKSHVVNHPPPTITRRKASSHSSKNSGNGRNALQPNLKPVLQHRTPRAANVKPANTSPVTRNSARRNRTDSRRNVPASSAPASEAARTASPVTPVAQVQSFLTGNIGDVTDITPSQFIRAAERRSKRRVRPISPTSSSSARETFPKRVKPDARKEGVHSPETVPSQSPPKSRGVPPRTASSSEEELESTQVRRRISRPRQQKTQPILISSDSDTVGCKKKKQSCTVPQSRSKLDFDDIDDNDEVRTNPSLTRTRSLKNGQKTTSTKTLSQGQEKKSHPLQQVQTQTPRRKRVRATPESDSEGDGTGLQEISDSAALDPEDADVSFVEGFEYVLGCIGGESTKSHVASLRRKIGAPNVKSQSQEKEWNDQPSEPFKHQADDYLELADDPDPASVVLDNSRKGNSLHIGPGNPFGEDEQTNTLNFSQRAKRPSHMVNRRAERNCMPDIHVPNKPIVVADVVTDVLALPDCAHAVTYAPGSREDDRTAQEEVSSSEWVVAAEKQIGFLRPENGSDPSVTSLACRRLWRAMSEAKVLETLGCSNFPGDSQLRASAGVCIRMLTLDFQLDISGVLIRELLAIREKQKAKGADSLELVLSSGSRERPTLRDRCVCALWALLFRIIQENYISSDPWEYVNGALYPLIDELFEKDKFRDRRYVKKLDMKIASLLNTLTMVISSSAFRLDALADVSEDEVTDHKELVPQNWAVICRSLETFSASAALIQDKAVAKKALMSLLSAVGTYVYRNVWPVSEDVVSSISVATHSVASMNDGSCFCETIARFPNASDDDQRKEDAGAFLADLRNPCEYSIYIGSVYVNKGGGNPAKKAMTLIRNASRLTNCGSQAKPSVRAVNHHISLLLSVADVMASTSSNGESLFCQMLTSRIPSLSSLPQAGDLDGASIEQCVQAILNAVRDRCEVLMISTKSTSIKVYYDWLSKNLIETILLVRKSSDRRLSSGSQREALRLHESIFAKAASQFLRTTTAVVNDMRNQMKQMSDELWHSVVGVVAEAAQTVAGLSNFCAEIEQKLRQNSEEALSKNRDVLMVDMLGTIEAIAKMAVTSFNEHSRRAVTDGSNDAVRDISNIVTTYTSILSESMDRLLNSIMESADIIRDKKNAARARSYASGITSVALGLRVLAKTPGFNEHGCSKLVELLRGKHLDVLRWDRLRGIGNSAGSTSETVVDESMMLNFWWEAASAGWMSRLLPVSSELESIILSGFAWLLVSDRELLDAGTRSKVGDIAQKLREVPKLRELPEWHETGPMNSLRGADTTHGHAAYLDALVAHGSEHWTMDKTRSLISQLRRRVQKSLSTKKGGALQKGLMLYARLFRAAAQNRGITRFPESRWVLEWLEELATGLHRARTGAGGAHAAVGDVMQVVQQDLAIALSTVSNESRSSELRLKTMRVVRALGDTDDLAALWRPVTAVAVVRSGGVGSERAAQRNASEWRGCIFRSAVGEELERGLRAGRVARHALRRLVAAARLAGEDRNGEWAFTVRRAVGKAVGEGRHRLLEADLAGYESWTEVCSLLDLELQ